MADSLYVVAIRVKDIRAVVVGVVAGAKTRRTVVAATRGKGRGVEGIDDRAVWRGKGDVQRRGGSAFREEEVNAPRGAKANRAPRLRPSRFRRVRAPPRRTACSRPGHGRGY